MNNKILKMNGDDVIKNEIVLYENQNVTKKPRLSSRLFYLLALAKTAY